MSSVKIPLLVLFKFKFWRMHPILNVPNFYEQWTTRTRTLFFLNAVTKNLTKHLKRWQKGPCFFYFIEKPFNSNCWLKGNEIYEKWSLPSNCFLLVSIWMATTRICVVSLRGVCFIVGSWNVSRRNPFPSNLGIEIHESWFFWKPWFWYDHWQYHAIIEV